MSDIPRILTSVADRAGRRVHEVFADWCACMAIATSVPGLRMCVPTLDLIDAREAEYARIMAKYPVETADTFAQAMSALVCQMEAEPRDILGSLYMEMGAPNERLGQFFTPYELSLACAQLTMGDVEDVVKARGYVSVSEPAAGSGGMLIAASQVMREKGLNPQRQMPCHAVDLSLTAVHMTYVQLSILGIPATVVHGNTLTLEVHSVWHTIMWQTWMWSARRPFANRPTVVSAREEDREQGQLTLFGVTP